ncbi:MAG: hypothetical protein HQ502_19605 [Alphaproteobacteria bacterium]|nr:hypothetical protein [Alphaproteobacteria bacterium]
MAHPSENQIRYLQRGLTQPGGKLPLFDELGQEIDVRTIRACIKAGWSEAWFANPLKPDWLVCRLTDSGREVLAKSDMHQVKNPFPPFGPRPV